MNQANPNDKEHSAATQSPTPLVVEAQADNKKNAAYKKTADPDHKKSYRRSWRSSQPTTKLTIIFTGVMALATALYMIFSGWQLYEIRSGGEETRKLAQAARDSADAAQRQAAIAEGQLQSVRDSAQAAKDSANAATRVVEQNRDLIAAAKTQADTSRISANAAQKSAEVAVFGTRAYLSIDHMRMLNPLEANQPIDLYFEFVNDGNSPAEISGYSTYFFDTQLQDCNYGIQKAFNQIVVAPKSPRTQRVVISRSGISQVSVDEIEGCTDPNKCKRYMQFCIKGFYNTVGGEFPFENCSYYFPGLHTFLECKKN
ncbi:MAG: hypothetical protein V7638_394 [Acidobacteriota bacterium]|jgi:hypothetical protein